MNRSRHTSLSQTIAQMRRRNAARSSGGSGTPYTPYTPSTGGVPPVANADMDQIVAINPDTGNVEVQFNGSNSHAPDVGTNPGDGIDSYAWNFDDGSTGSGEMPTHPYTSAGTYTVTLTVTDKDKPAKSSSTTIEVTVVSIEPQSVKDGETAQFTVFGATDATAYSWGWSAPNGATNSPMVTFSSPNSSTTSVPSAKWFALANVPSFPVKACGDDKEVANRSCKYTITCDIIFPNNTSVTATSSLTVNVPWSPGGIVDIGISAKPTIAYNVATQLWEVTGLGDSRRVIRKTIYVPQSSQFYDKVNTHEQVHYEQYDTGIALSYYTLDDFWQNHLQGLTATTSGILRLSIPNAVHNFITAEDDRIEPLKPQMEADAYNVSDPKHPQYVYMNCGEFP